MIHGPLTPQGGSTETLIQAILAIGMLIGLVLVGVLIVQSFRGGAAKRGPGANELLMNFQEMRSRGDIDRRGLPKNKVGAGSTAPSRAKGRQRQGLEQTAAVDPATRLAAAMPGGKMCLAVLPVSSGARGLAWEAGSSRMSVFVNHTLDHLADRDATNGLTARSIFAASLRAALEPRFAVAHTGCRNRRGVIMPAGKDLSGGRRGASTTKKNAFCSFCRKSYRDVGPLVEGPGDVYICGECIDLCQSILEQEQRRRGTTKPLFTRIPTPREIVTQLDQYVIGQEYSKRILAVAVHSHYKRLSLRLRRLGRRNREIEHPAGRPHRLAARRCSPARWPAS